jgi:NAD(P)-dependent dehydrogenase (short-subunit alcohol dehydrogenase family)
MNLSGNTVLITGGATGIGLAMADAFLKAGSEVVICGRRLRRTTQYRQMQTPASVSQAAGQAGQLWRGGEHPSARNGAQSCCKYAPASACTARLTGYGQPSRHIVLSEALIQSESAVHLPFAVR